MTLNSGVKNILCFEYNAFSVLMLETLPDPSELAIARPPLVS